MKNTTSATPTKGTTTGKLELEIDAGILKQVKAEAKRRKITATALIEEIAMEALAEMPTSIPIEQSVLRLAKQFGMTPEALTDEILRAGIVALDEDMGFGNDGIQAPLVLWPGQSKEPLDRSRTISGVIASMAPAKMAGVSAAAKAEGISIQEVIACGNYGAITLLDAQ